MLFQLFSKTVLGFVLFFALLLGACSQTQLPALHQKAKVVAFGDSLTEGYGVKKGEDYPSVLGELTGLQVINEGVSGETSAQGLERMPKVLELHQPDLVILLEGGNDVLRKIPLEKTKANLAAMIGLIQDSGASVLLVGMPEKKLFGGTLPLYEELAEQYRVPLLDDVIGSLLMRASMKSDYVHFNEKGYAVLAEEIYFALQEYGALE
ncbi:arylesterase [Thiomicrorhabdus sediminis]|uniref:Arylesterase n=1 Tax=Thiomicrorhabdus sediminis TaxID=2580412 RepID=A0A4P9K9X6_9GAMM|nr:arylesterase [Thiomicrorhabdus sediminis]